MNDGRAGSALKRNRSCAYLTLMGSNYSHLSSEQRLEIQHGLRAGLSMAQIASKLGVDRSTVHREVKRVAEQVGGQYTAVRGERAYESGRKQNGLARRKV